MNSLPDTEVLSQEEMEQVNAELSQEYIERLENPEEGEENAPSNATDEPVYSSRTDQ